MAPTTRSMAARAAKANGTKVAGSRVSKAARSKSAGSKACRRSKSDLLSCSKPVRQGLPQAKTPILISHLSLPGELRNMVYRYFISSAPITTKRHLITPSQLGITQTPDSFWPTANTGVYPPRIMVVRRSLPIALLSTCRTLYMEVAPLFKPLLTRLAMEPLRICAIGGHAAAVALTCPPSPLIACLGAQVQSSSQAITLNKTGQNFIALCRRPPSSYTTGDVDIELSIGPKHELQPAGMLQRVFEGIQARINESMLRFRVVLHRPRPWYNTEQRPPAEPMPQAGLNMRDRVDVRDLDFVQWTDHSHALSREI